MPTHHRQDSPAPPGRSENAPLKEAPASPTTTESPREAAELAADEAGSSTPVVVVIEAPTRPELGPVAAVGAGWVGEVAETTARLRRAVITRSSRARVPVADTARTVPSTTLPAHATAVKPAARARSMRRSPRGGGREAQRPGARVPPVTSASLTRKRLASRKRRQRMALTTSPAAVLLLPSHPDLPRPGSSLPGVYPPEGAEGEAVEVAAFTGAVAVQEGWQGVTGPERAQPRTAGLQSPRPQPESSRPGRRALAPKNQVVEEAMQRRERRTKHPMETWPRVREPTHLHQRRLQPFKVLLKTEGLWPRSQQPTPCQTLEGLTHPPSLAAEGSLLLTLSDHLDVVAMGVPNTSRTSPLGFAA